MKINFVKKKELSKTSGASITEPESKLKWQKGDYKRTLKFKHCLPYQFLLLCKLMDITPRQALIDFMDNLACGSWKREGRDQAKEKLIAYFIEHGYGRKYYSLSEIQTIFKEMDSIGSLFPTNAKTELIDLHSHWRRNYHRFWFSKWYKKMNRKA